MHVLLGLVQKVVQQVEDLSYFLLFFYFFTKKVKKKSKKYLKVFSTFPDELPLTCAANMGLRRTSTLTCAYLF